MIFDQYQRYKTVETIANLLRGVIQKQKLSVLEIGANEECNLETILPDDDIQYSDIELSEEMKKKHFIQIDGCDMQEVMDGQYDIVIALDVLEHVPAEQRERFMKEINRVSQYMAIVCFPYKSEFNESAEKRVNAYYKMLYGSDHKWLIEHIQNGLPKRDEIVQKLLSSNIYFKEFYHGDIFLWEEMMKALFTVYDLQYGGYYFEQIDKLYEEQIYFNDCSMSAYRLFMMLSKDENLLLNISAKLEEKYSTGNLEKVNRLLFRSIDDIKFRLINEQGRKISIQHQIYYSYCGDFDEMHKFVLASEGLNANCIKINKVVKIDEKYKALRFDPIEGEYCILKNLIIESDKGAVNFEVINGIWDKDKIVFCDDDPQIYIDLSSEVDVKWIRISGDLLRTEFPEAIIRNLLEQKIDNSADKLEGKIDVNIDNLAEVNGLVREYIQTQNEINLRLDRYNELLDLKTKQCEEMQVKLNEALIKEWDIRSEKERWEEQSGVWERRCENWEEQSKNWEEQSKNWEEQSKNWEEQSKNWEERCIRMEQTISWRITGILRKIGKILNIGKRK